VPHYVNGFVVPVPKNIPFDGKKMFWVGFKTIVEL
jgi:uncharacterized protein YbaA (DUF1428 family)